MNGYQWYTITGWTFAALIAVLGLSIVTGSMFTPVPLKAPAYVVEGVVVEAAATGPDAGAEAEPPFAVLLASADVARGESQFKKCAACHTIQKGGAHGIGPNIWGIVGDEHADEAGFAYSTAMAATAGKKWDWESLSAWLKNPKEFMPGNKMSFAGLSKAKDRADLLAYLNTKSDAPLSLPAAPTAAVPAEAAAPADASMPAEGAPAPTA